MAHVGLFVVCYMMHVGYFTNPSAFTGPSKSGHHRTHQRSSSHGKISDQDFMNTFSGPQPLQDPYADTNRLPFYPPTHIDALKPPFLSIETGMHHASTVPQDIHTLGQTQAQGLTSIDHIHALEPRYRPSGYGDHHMRGARPKSGSELEGRYTSLRGGPAQYQAEGTKRSFSMDPQIPINNKPLGWYFKVTIETDVTENYLTFLIEMLKISCPGRNVLYASRQLRHVVNRKNCSSC